MDRFLSGEEPEQLTFRESNDDLACWSPDFKKSPELNPQNTNAKERLKRLEKKQIDVRITFDASVVGFADTS